MAPTQAVYIAPAPYARGMRVVVKSSSNLWVSWGPDSGILLWDWDPRRSGNLACVPVPSLLPHQPSLVTGTGYLPSSIHQGDHHLNRLDRSVVSQDKPLLQEDNSWETACRPSLLQPIMDTLWTSMISCFPDITHFRIFQWYNFMCHEIELIFVLKATVSEIWDDLQGGGSKFSLISLYRQRFLRYGPIFKMPKYGKFWKSAHSSETAVCRAKIIPISTLWGRKRVYVKFLEHVPMTKFYAPK